jgi:DNA-binding transcriptional ArsR family regulator
MPGGRLSAEDRHRIASGLAAGRSLAEIARQLARPTSTVSREVARNSGPDGYLAEHAHQATRRRARRRRSALSPQELPDKGDAFGRDPASVRRFVDQLVVLMVQTGLPRMAARVFACLVTTDSGVLTAAELTARLSVSPASVSKAIAYLEGIDLVRRERDPHWRRERYLIDDDLWHRTWRTDAERHVTWASTALQGAQIFGASTPAGARLDQMGQFFGQLAREMAGGPITAAAADDALTVLAALLYAGEPLTEGQLAGALGWPSERVAEALSTADAYPEIADPIALHHDESGTYSINTSPHRLSAPQRQALLRRGPHSERER